MHAREGLYSTTAFPPPPTRANSVGPTSKAFICTVVVQVRRQVTPNPSIERTRNGMPRMALISFWAMRVLPLRAAQLKR